MTVAQRMARGLAATATMITLAGCASGAGGGLGSIGDILGGVLGGGQPMQLNGTVQSIDARSQQVAIQQQNGQTMGVLYDNRTRVVYQNRIYPISSLEFGDQVVARLQDNGNNTYYTDSIYVTVPVNGTDGRGSTGVNTNTTAVQSLQGTVRQVDLNAGWFTINANNNVVITVTLPYRPSNADAQRFNNLRAGDFVRFYGVFVNNSRVELRQFY